MFTKKIAAKTMMDNDGNLIGSKSLKLKHHSILIEALQDGAAISGGLIYWNGTKYTGFNRVSEPLNCIP